jgi:hypothetical protein
VNPVEPAVKVQFGTGTPPMYAWTPDIVAAIVPVLPLGAELKVNEFVAVPPVVVVEVGMVTEYLAALTDAPPLIVLVLENVITGEPPVSVQPAIVPAPILKPTPLIVPMPKADRLIVNVVLVPPVGIVVPEVISIIYGIFGGAIVTACVPFETHDVILLFDVA